MTNDVPSNIAHKDADLEDADLKIILLGDSAVGKSKLVERFLLEDYVPRQLSTYALTLYRHIAKIDEGKTIKVDFWDTAGQERFSQMHPSYYYKAHACILVFDCDRKITYTHLSGWLKELREYCKNIPVICICNKIDINEKVTKKKFKFPQKHNMPFFFVSAASGTNVVRVFEKAIELGWEHKTKSGDWMSDVMSLLEDSHIDDDFPLRKKKKTPVKE